MVGRIRQTTAGGSYERSHQQQSERQRQQSLGGSYGKCSGRGKHRRRHAGRLADESGGFSGFGGTSARQTLLGHRRQQLPFTQGRYRGTGHDRRHRAP